MQSADCLHCTLHLLWDEAADNGMDVTCHTQEPLLRNERYNSHVCCLALVLPAAHT